MDKLGSELRTLDQVGFNLLDTEYLNKGHSGCTGCGSLHTMRYALKALGNDTVVIVTASCWSLICASLKVPLIHCAFEAAGAWATGVRAGLDVIGETETNVVAWAGDGGTFDIGLQSLSGAAERNENFIFICNDNEAYMNTGIQRSSATPAGAWTTTTPIKHTKSQPKKNITEIIAAHRVPYVATATPGYPEDYVRKVTRAKFIKGTRFIHVMSPCPTGWRYAPSITIKLARLAVQCRIFPLYEVEDGYRYTLQKPRKTVAVDEYLKLQGRFSTLTKRDINNIQRNVDMWWEQLEHKASSVQELPW
jgi:pyruvate ferredoxin oxidoreductase beta subunit/2-oxoisovalerate ferredoxin oxidoreductase beta subunit